MSGACSEGTVLVVASEACSGGTAAVYVESGAEVPALLTTFLDTQLSMQWVNSLKCGAKCATTQERVYLIGTVNPLPHVDVTTL